MMRVLAFPLQDICTGNPYTALLYRGMLVHDVAVEEFSFRRLFKQRPDVVHIHWPDGHLRCDSLLRGLAKHARLALALAWLRLGGGRVVWTMHNVKSHEKNHALLNRLFAWWFPRMVTHLIALTETGYALALANYPSLRKKTAAVIPHGHYRTAYSKMDKNPPGTGKYLSQSEGVFVYGFFGAIRPYKQVPRLIEEFLKLTKGDMRLIIAGRPANGALSSAVEVAANGCSRITLRLELVPDDDVPSLFSAIDLVVLPFEDILNSGSAMLALSFSCPVLAPRMGALVELQAAVGEHWLMLYEGEFDVTQLVRAQELVSFLDRSIPPDLSAFEWDKISASTVELYRRAC